MLITCFLRLTVPTFSSHSCLVRVDYEGVQVVWERNMVAERLSEARLVFSCSSHLVGTAWWVYTILILDGVLLDVCDNTSLIMIFVLLILLQAILELTWSGLAWLARVIGCKGVHHFLQSVLLKTLDVRLPVWIVVFLFRVVHRLRLSTIFTSVNLGGRALAVIGWPKLGFHNYFTLLRNRYKIYNILVERCFRCDWLIERCEQNFLF